MRACFQIWQNKEPNGKPIPGSYDWTALSGKHKLLVLQKLPAKMDTLLRDNLSAHVAKLWNVSMCYLDSLETIVGNYWSWGGGMVNPTP